MLLQTCFEPPSQLPSPPLPSPSPHPLPSPPSSSNPLFCPLSTGHKFSDDPAWHWRARTGGDVEGSTRFSGLLKAPPHSSLSQAASQRQRERERERERDGVCLPPLPPPPPHLPPPTLLLLLLPASLLPSIMVVVAQAPPLVV